MFNKHLDAITDDFPMTDYLAATVIKDREMINA